MKRFVGLVLLLATLSEWRGVAAIDAPRSLTEEGDEQTAYVIATVEKMNDAKSLDTLKAAFKSLQIEIPDENYDSLKTKLSDPKAIAVEFLVAKTNPVYAEIVGDLIAYQRPANALLGTLLFPFEFPLFLLSNLLFPPDVSFRLFYRFYALMGLFLYPFILIVYPVLGPLVILGDILGGEDGVTGFIVGILDFLLGALPIPIGADSSIAADVSDQSNPFFYPVTLLFFMVEALNEGDLALADQVLLLYPFYLILYPILLPIIFATGEIPLLDQLLGTPFPPDGNRRLGFLDMVVEFVFGSSEAKEPKTVMDELVVGSGMNILNQGFVNDLNYRMESTDFSFSGLSDRVKEQLSDENIDDTVEKVKTASKWVLRNKIKREDVEMLQP